MVVDGSGQPRFEADVGVSRGRIEAVGRLDRAEAARVIDASGLVVAPGFIDMHSHSDVTLLDDPGGESKAHQGVTTEVTGQLQLLAIPVRGRAAGRRAGDHGLHHGLRDRVGLDDDGRVGLQDGSQRRRHQRRGPARAEPPPHCSGSHRRPACHAGRGPRHEASRRGVDRAGRFQHHDGPDDHTVVLRAKPARSSSCASRSRATTARSMRRTHGAVRGGTSR